MHARSPSSKQFRELKERHGLTYVTMSDPLYGVSKRSIQNWANGRRECPPLVWWALVLHFDGVDLRYAGKI